MLLTQLENEARMYFGGVKRAEDRMSAAEAKGRADQNPYAKTVFSMFVQPLAAAIKAACAPQKGAGRAQAHVALLRPLDPDAVAYLAVSSALSALMGRAMGGGELYNQPTTRTVGHAIGKTIYGELVIAQIAAGMPELHYSLLQELTRRKSKDERHRVTMMRHEAEKHGLTVVEWPRGAREQIGMYLLGLLEVAEMVEIAPPTYSASKKAYDYQEVYMGREVLSQIEAIRDYVSKHLPVWGPCVEPPIDWTSGAGGGFHGRQLRALHPTLVRGQSEVKELCRGATMPVVLSAVNALQRTPWAVNRRVLAAIRAVGGAFSLKELVRAEDTPRPPRPEFLDRADETTLTEYQQTEFVMWKRATAEWHTRRKLLGTKVGRLTATLEAADMFAEYPAIYFVYFADSRGRLYPMTYGLNPQGSDLQKSLIMFANGKPLNSPEAIRWFLVNGANKFGFDKATLEERAQWVIDRQDLILGFADNPVDNRGWAEADNPLQFLAWAFEYASWVRDTRGTFVSHLPVSMDGSCNGLQNLSALLRDEIGGAATNITPSSKMRDIYADVALAALKRMQESPPLEEPSLESLRMKWLAHGINRKVVKRSVMTTPYGVTRQSAVKYVVADYLAEGAGGSHFEKSEYRKAAEVLMMFVWPAIGDIVVKGREAMAWLRKAAPKILRKLSKEAPQIITWVSPSGFIACQEYFEGNVHRINTFLKGPVKIRITSETEDPDSNRHSNGMAPNFVHSMDAAHLHLTTDAAARSSIDHLAMIHDDYGTHAADSQKLYELIREQFLAMYTNSNPIHDFYFRYPEAGEPPDNGTLKLESVLQSKFFFS